MPNGQSDLFRIGREAFVRMLGALGDEPVRCIKLGAGDWKEYSTAEAIKTVNGSLADELVVEELNGEIYWVHVEVEGRYLIEIGPEATPYRELRRHHREIRE